MSHKMFVAKASALSSIRVMLFVTEHYSSFLCLHFQILKIGCMELFQTTWDWNASFGFSHVSSRSLWIIALSHSHQSFLSSSLFLSLSRIHSISVCSDHHTQQVSSFEFPLSFAVMMENGFQTAASSSSSSASSPSSSSSSSSSSSANTTTTTTIATADNADVRVYLSVIEELRNQINEWSHKYASLQKEHKESVKRDKYNEKASEGKMKEERNKVNESETKDRFEGENGNSSTQ